MVVFQNGALFPWKTLAENVAYGPIVQKRMSKSEARDKAYHMLAEAGLGDFGDKYPGEVSSGMARRAEIVRALINEPKVLLLDEPYRAMDALTKSIMHESLLETYDRTKVTIFFITHDLEEAIFLGDKVHIVTTRPCSLKKTVDVTIPRPRTYESLSSETFRHLRRRNVHLLEQHPLGPGVGWLRRQRQALEILAAVNPLDCVAHSHQEARRRDALL